MELIFQTQIRTFETLVIKSTATSDRVVSATRQSALGLEVGIRKIGNEFISSVIEER